MATALTVFFNNKAASATLATANPLFPTVGGTIGITATTLIGTASGWGEIYSRGNAGAWAAAGSMGSPSGHGWFLDATTLDGQDIIAGTWTPTPGYKMSVAAGNMTADIWINAYVYNGGVYTLIGSCSLAAQSITSTVTSFTFAGTSLAKGTFPTGSKLYIDNWLHITTPGTNASATCAVRQATTTANGAVTGQVVTPGFAPSVVALAVTIPGVGTLTGTMSANTALASTIAGVGTLTGTFSLSTALSTTIPGVGTLSPTLAIIAWHTSDTIPGVGTLAGTMSANTALSATLAGIGTLAGTLSANTALSSTLAGVGTISGTLSANTALSATIAGVGTLTGTLSVSGSTVALTATLAGVGTLTATLSANTALSTTVIGTGTLAGVLALSTALSTSLAGAGTLVGVFTLRVALSLTFAGVGTLAGTLTGAAATVQFLSATWITRDLAATWKTRDVSAAWKARL